MNSKKSDEQANVALSQILIGKAKADIAERVFSIAKMNGILSKEAKMMSESFDIESNKAIPEILKRIITETLFFVHKINKKLKK